MASTTSFDSSDKTLLHPSLTCHHSQSKKKCPSTTTTVLPQQTQREVVQRQRQLCKNHTTTTTDEATWKMQEEEETHHHQHQQTFINNNINSSNHDGVALPHENRCSISSSFSLPFPVLLLLRAAAATTTTFNFTDDGVTGARGNAPNNTSNNHLIKKKKDVFSPKTQRRPSSHLTSRSVFTTALVAAVLCAVILLIPVPASAGGGGGHAPGTCAQPSTKHCPIDGVCTPNSCLSTIGAAQQVQCNAAPGGGGGTSAPSAHRSFHRLGNGHDNDDHDNGNNGHGNNGNGHGNNGNGHGNGHGNDDHDNGNNGHGHGNDDHDNGNNGNGNGHGNNGNGHGNNGHGNNGHGHDNDDHDDGNGHDDDDHHHATAECQAMACQLINPACDPQKKKCLGVTIPTTSSSTSSSSDYETSPIGKSCLLFKGKFKVCDCTHCEVGISFEAPFNYTSFPLTTTSCRLLTPCGALAVRSQPDSVEQDRLCRCQSGAWNPSPSLDEIGKSCIPWTDCGDGAEEATPGTSQTDRLCQCQAGYFNSTTTDSIPGKICQPWTDCGDNTLVAVTGSSSQDQQCECSVDYFNAEIIGPAVEKSCIPHTPCGLGAQPTVSGTTTTDTQCECIRDVSNDQLFFNDTHPGPMAGKSCTAVTKCDPQTEREDLPSTLTTDTICQPAFSQEFSLVFSGRQWGSILATQLTALKEKLEADLLAIISMINNPSIRIDSLTEGSLHIRFTLLSSTAINDDVISVFRQQMIATTSFTTTLAFYRQTTGGEDAFVVGENGKCPQLHAANSICLSDKLFSGDNECDFNPHTLENNCAQMAWMSDYNLYPLSNPTAEECVTECYRLQAVCRYVSYNHLTKDCILHMRSAPYQQQQNSLCRFETNASFNVYSPVDCVPPYRMNPVRNDVKCNAELSNGCVVQVNKTSGGHYPNQDACFNSFTFGVAISETSLTLPQFCDPNGALPCPSRINECSDLCRSTPSCVHVWGTNTLVPTSSDEGNCWFFFASGFDKCVVEPLTTPGQSGYQMKETNCTLPYTYQPQDALGASALVQPRGDTAPAVVEPSSGFMMQVQCIGTTCLSLISASELQATTLDGDQQLFTPLTASFSNAVRFIWNSVTNRVHVITSAATIIHFEVSVGWPSAGATTTGIPAGMSSASNAVFMTALEPSGSIAVTFHTTVLSFDAYMSAAWTVLEPLASAALGIAASLAGAGDVFYIHRVGNASDPFCRSFVDIYNSTILLDRRIGAIPDPLFENHCSELAFPSSSSSTSTTNLGGSMTRTGESIVIIRAIDWTAHSSTRIFLEQITFTGVLSQPRFLGSYSAGTIKNLVPHGHMGAVFLIIVQDQDHDMLVTTEIGNEPFVPATAASAVPLGETIVNTWIASVFDASRGIVNVTVFTQSQTQQSEYRYLTPTHATTGQCYPTTPCGARTTEIAPPTPTSNRICLPTAVNCVQGQSYALVENPVIGAVCVPLTLCDSTTEFQCVAPTPVSDRKCCAVSVCDEATEDVYTPATAFRDTVCVSKRRCPAGTWSPTIPPTSCQPLTQPPTGQQLVSDSTSFYGSCAVISRANKETRLFRADSLTDPDAVFVLFNHLSHQLLTIERIDINTGLTLAETTFLPNFKNFQDLDARVVRGELHVVGAAILTSGGSLVPGGYWAHCIFDAQTLAPVGDHHCDNLGTVIADFRPMLTFKQSAVQMRADHEGYLVLFAAMTHHTMPNLERLVTARYDFDQKKFVYWHARRSIPGFNEMSVTYGLGQFNAQALWVYTIVFETGSCTGTKDHKVQMIQLLAYNSLTYLRLYPAIYDQTTSANRNEVCARNVDIVHNHKASPDQFVIAYHIDYISASIPSGAQNKFAAVLRLEMPPGFSPTPIPSIDLTRNGQIMVASYDNPPKRVVSLILMPNSTTKITVYYPTADGFHTQALMDIHDTTPGYSSSHCATHEPSHNTRNGPYAVLQPIVNPFWQILPDTHGIKVCRVLYPTNHDNIYEDPNTCQVTRNERSTTCGVQWSCHTVDAELVLQYGLPAAASERHFDALDASTQKDTLSNLVSLWAGTPTNIVMMNVTAKKKDPASGKMFAVVSVRIQVPNGVNTTNVVLTLENSTPPTSALAAANMESVQAAYVHETLAGTPITFRVNETGANYLIKSAIAATASAVPSTTTVSPNTQPLSPTVASDSPATPTPPPTSSTGMAKPQVAADDQLTSTSDTQPLSSSPPTSSLISTPIPTSHQPSQTTTSKPATDQNSGDAANNSSSPSPSSSSTIAPTTTSPPTAAKEDPTWLWMVLAFVGILAFVATITAVVYILYILLCRRSFVFEKEKNLSDENPREDERGSKEGTPPPQRPLFADDMIMEQASADHDDESSVAPAAVVVVVEEEEDCETPPQCSSTTLPPSSSSTPPSPNDPCVMDEACDHPEGRSKEEEEEEHSSIRSSNFRQHNGITTNPLLASARRGEEVEDSY